MTDTERIQMPEKYRERFDQIKQECKEADPGVPEPSDEVLLSSLMDTWDAVGMGLYSEPDDSEHEETTKEKGDRVENEAVHILSCTYGTSGVDKCYRYSGNDPLRFIDIIAAKEGFPVRFVQVKANRFTSKQRDNYAYTVGRFPDEVRCEVWVRVDYEGWEIYHFDRGAEEWVLWLEIDTCDKSEAVEPFRDATGYYQDPSDRRDDGQAGLEEVTSP